MLSHQHPLSVPQLSSGTLLKSSWGKLSQPCVTLPSVGQPLQNRVDLDSLLPFSNLINRRLLHGDRLMLISMTTRLGKHRWIRSFSDLWRETLNNLRWCVWVHVCTCVFTPLDKSTRPTCEILLSLWPVMMLIVGIFFDIFGKMWDIQFRYFWSRKSCVYQITVTL